jgi:hypothetical protein
VCSVIFRDGSTIVFAGSTAKGAGDMETFDVTVEDKRFDNAKINSANVVIH